MALDRSLRMDCPGISDKRKDPDRGQATGADPVEVSAPPPIAEGPARCARRHPCDP